MLVPFVNIDSYIFINENWKNRINGKEILMIRKNRNIDNRCNFITGGVDLNRNYSFKFGLDNIGSSNNPCEEDYRGTKPFSEPEIRSIKELLVMNKSIISNINFHTYGNAWLYPYNFIHDKNDNLLHK